MSEGLMHAWQDIEDQYPQLYSSEIGDFLLALDLVYDANLAFDRRHMAAATLSLAISHKLQAVEEFEQANREFRVYCHAATVLMPPRSAFDREALD